MTISLNEPQTLPISEIRRDGGTQPRESTNWEVAWEYAEAMQEGVVFPPVTVYFDGENYWLADGFHRIDAAVFAGVNEFPVDIHEGTQRDAVLHSVGANAAHGLRRTNEDKRKAVLTMLSDDEWSQWPQAEIAKQCGVSREYVNRLSRDFELSSDRSQDSTRTVTRNGTTYTQDTSNIGRRQEDPDEPDTEPDTEPGDVAASWNGLDDVEEIEEEEIEDETIFDDLGDSEDESMAAHNVPSSHIIVDMVVQHYQQLVEDKPLGTAREVAVLLIKHFNEALSGIDRRNS